jgi:TPR repeat protein
MRAFGLLILAWTATAEAGPPCKQGDVKACADACGAKNGASCGEAGLMAEQGKLTKDGKPDGSAAVTWYSAGCGLKHVGSCRRLALIYHDGLYGYHDAAKAAAAYKTACTLHEQGACMELAMMQLHGDGIPSMPAKGIAGLEAACKANYAFACTEAGIAYAKGEAHGKAEPAKAKAMFTRACKMKNEPDPRACDYLVKPI